MTFTTGGGYTLVAQGPLGVTLPVVRTYYEAIPAGPPVTLSGTYVLNEASGQVAFTGAQTGAATIDVPYDFSGDDELTFSVENGALIADLILTANPDVDPALASIVRGGSMTLTRR